MTANVKACALRVGDALDRMLQGHDLQALAEGLLCGAAVADEEADKGGGDQARLRCEASRGREYAATLALLHVGERTQRLEETLLKMKT